MNCGPHVLGGVPVDVARLYVKELQPSPYGISGTLLYLNDCNRSIRCKRGDWTKLMLTIFYFAIAELAEDIPVESVASGYTSVRRFEDDLRRDGGRSGYSGSDNGIPSLFDVGPAVYHDDNVSGNQNNDFYADVDVSGGFFREEAKQNNYRTNNNGQDEVDYAYSHPYSTDYRDSSESPLTRLSGCGQRKLKKMFRQKRFVPEGTVGGGGGSRNLQEIKITRQPTMKSFPSSNNNVIIQLQSNQSVEVFIDGKNRGNTLTQKMIKRGPRPSSTATYCSSSSPGVKEMSPIVMEVTSESNQGRREESYSVLAREMAQDMEGIQLDEQVGSFCQLFPLSITKRNERIRIAEELKYLLIKRFSSCEVHFVGNDFVGIATDLDELMICIDPFGNLN